MSHPPTATPLPPASYANGTGDQPNGSKREDKQFEVPALQLQIRDLKHPGAKRFLAAVNATESLSTGTLNLLRLLYNAPSDAETKVPSTSSVTLILEDMPGVAYTVGLGEDNNQKEIHFSLSYIAQIDPSRIAEEIDGVLTHELVHCFQYNGLGTAPGGLIEGIADWVRLHCKLAPPHWKKETNHNWDAGYQHTAYFLVYLEKRFGDDAVRRINEKLRESQYENKFWVQLFGRTIDQLFEEYKNAV